MGWGLEFRRKKKSFQEKKKNTKLKRFQYLFTRGLIVDLV